MMTTATGNWAQHKHWEQVYAEEMHCGDDFALNQKHFQSETTKLKTARTDENVRLSLISINVFKLIGI